MFSNTGPHKVYALSSSP